MSLDLRALTKKEIKEGIVAENRIGSFAIASELIYGNPELVAVVLRDCIVVRAEHMFARDAVEYHAYHRDFARQAPGATAPRYTAIITENRAGDFVAHAREWRQE